MRYKNRNLATYGLPKESLPKKDSSVPEYDLEKGINQLVKLIKEKVACEKRPIVVLIGGGSSSGKTEKVAKKIKEIFKGESVILIMDDYYRGEKFKKAEALKGNVLTWDNPEMVEFELLETHLRELKSGKSICKPVYSFKTGERTNDKELLAPQKVIIADGLFALNDSLAKEGDIRVFVHTDVIGRMLRRLARDITRTGQTPAKIIQYFLEAVQPMHEKYVEITKGNADLIIKNEYDPQLEPQNIKI